MGIFDIFKNKSGKEDLDINELSRPEFTPEFEALINQGYDYLDEQQEIMEKEYALGTYEKWFYDQETGLLTFSDGDVVKIKILYEEVGSISKISETWLWAWANTNLEEKVRAEITQVKKYGEEHNFEPLIKRKWDATEIDGWEMAGISALLLNAKGCYRVPTENTYSFMIFKEVIDLRN